MNNTQRATRVPDSTTANPHSGVDAAAPGFPNPGAAAPPEEAS